VLLPLWIAGWMARCRGLGKKPTRVLDLEQRMTQAGEELGSSELQIFLKNTPV